VAEAPGEAEAAPVARVEAVGVVRVEEAAAQAAPVGAGEAPAAQVARGEARMQAVQEAEEASSEE
jgi:hypothetical protein